jgi:hypothetical protein
MFLIHSEKRDFDNFSKLFKGLNSTAYQTTLKVMFCIANRNELVLKMISNIKKEDIFFINVVFEKGMKKLSVKFVEFVSEKRSTIKTLSDLKNQIGSNLVLKWPKSVPDSKMKKSLSAYLNQQGPFKYLQPECIENRLSCVRLVSKIIPSSVRVLRSSNISNVHDAFLDSIDPSAIDPASTNKAMDIVVVNKVTTPIDLAATYLCPGPIDLVDMNQGPETPIPMDVNTESIVSFEAGFSDPVDPVLELDNNLYDEKNKNSSEMNIVSELIDVESHRINFYGFDSNYIDTIDVGVGENVTTEDTSTDSAVFGTATFFHLTDSNTSTTIDPNSIDLLGPVSSGSSLGSETPRTKSSVAVGGTDTPPKAATFIDAATTDGNSTGSAAIDIDVRVPLQVWKYSIVNKFFPSFPLNAVQTDDEAERFLNIQLPSFYDESIFSSGIEKMIFDIKTL